VAYRSIAPDLDRSFPKGLPFQQSVYREEEETQEQHLVLSKLFLGGEYQIKGVVT